MYAIILSQSEEIKYIAWLQIEKNRINTCQQFLIDNSIYLFVGFYEISIAKWIPKN